MSPETHQKHTIKVNHSFIQICSKHKRTNTSTRVEPFTTERTKTIERKTKAQTNAKYSSKES